jgi:hypothetical protein
VERLERYDTTTRDFVLAEDEIDYTVDQPQRGSRPRHRWY